ncbi:hypothetical protein CKY20_01635 [Capnocytophaga canis]|uniref:Ig-like domain-containing protein n=1 Tax=Capnocytophaga canis TaxID=1848903 RepID=A0A3A1YJ25_9FLAO|nr:gliding motility-associated C-terminal domain-containing protein [Capnocytophaga canis]RIY38273.1 hypothetical protein CKY20_01635 [Capnocytophaga canis]
MKKINILWGVLFFLVAPLSKIWGQCDANDLLYFESIFLNTSYVHRVTIGDKGIIYLENTYDTTDYVFTATDNATGDVYTATYDPIAKAMAIDVGIFNASPSERRFTVKGLKGTCVHVFPGSVKLRPANNRFLNVRYRHEDCTEGGAIYLNMVGAGIDATNYRYFYKREADTHFTVLPSNSIENLPAGKYQLKAERISPPGQVVEANPKVIVIKDKKKDIRFVAQGQYCAAPAAGTITVTMTESQSFPHIYRLRNWSDGSLITEQSSHVFTGLSEGEYRVDVENACGDIRVGNNPVYIKTSPPSFSNANTDYVVGASTFKAGCDRDMSFTSQVSTDYEVLQGDKLPYPLTVTLVYTSPTNQVYTNTHVYNSKQDIIDNGGDFDLSSNQGKLFFKKDHVELGIPKESGVWNIRTIIQEGCGGTIAFDKNKNTKKVETREQVLDKGLSLEQPKITCQDKGLAVKVTGVKESFDVVLEDYPSEFNPIHAGFYKTSTYGNSYVKEKVTNSVVIVSPEFLKLGDYRVRVIFNDNPSCVFSFTRSITVISTTTSPEAYFSFHSYLADCEQQRGAIGLRFDKENPPQQIRIMSYSGNHSDLPTGMVLPYVITYPYPHTNLPTHSMTFRNMPPGTYKIRGENFSCGADKELTITTVENPYPTVTWEVDAHCRPTLKIDRPASSPDSYEILYELMAYNPITKIWENPNPAPPPSRTQRSLYGEILFKGNERPLIQNLPPIDLSQYSSIYTKFRVFARRGLNQLGCSDNIISEYDFASQRPTISDVRVVHCQGNSYGVQIIGEGGREPYTYQILRRNGIALTTYTPTNHGFFMIDESSATATYSFAISDACGNRKILSRSLANIIPVEITPNRIGPYCQGVPAELSIPDMTKSFDYSWVRSDGLGATSTGTTLSIPSLEVGDFAPNYYVLTLTPKSFSTFTCTLVYTHTFTMGMEDPLPDFSTVSPVVVECAPPEGKVLPTNYDIKDKLFGSLQSFTGVITEQSGNYVVPEESEGTVNINLRVLQRTVGNQATFVYTYTSPCGQVTSTTATLIIQRAVGVKTQTLSYCVNSPLTLQQVEEHVRTAIKRESPDNVFIWYDSNTAITPTTTPPNAVVTSTMYYSVYLSGTDPSCELIRAPVFFVINDPHAIDPDFINVGKTVCKGATVEDLISKLPNISAATASWIIYQIVGSSKIKLPKNYVLKPTEIYHYGVETTVCEPETRAVTLSFSTLTVTTQPNSVVVCENEAVILSVLASSSIGTEVYQWYENGVATTTGASLITGATSSTYTPSTGTGGSKYYYVKISNPFCDDIFSDIVSVTVKTQPIIPVVNTSHTIVCQGTPAYFEITGAPNTVVNYRLNDTSASVNLFGGSTSVTVSGVIGVHTLTLTSVSNAEGCVVTPIANVATITVISKPIANIQVTNATCVTSGIATITNYDTSYTYTFNDPSVTHVGEIITGFTIGNTYTMTLSNGVCSATTTFVVQKICEINAQNDTITIEVGSTSTETVHANDSLGGVGVNSSTVSTSILNDAGSGVAITSEGTLTVASSTSTGIYTITYQICEIGAVPENCATATVTLIVTKVQTPTNVINAQNDTITIEVGSTSTETVHANDSLGGVGVTSSTVSTSILNDGGSGVAITSEGTLTVASSTSTGTYTITYQICEIGAVPENCATATVTLIVTKIQTPTNIINAQNDTITIEVGSTSTETVHANDSLGGVGVNSSTVSTSILNDGGSGVAITSEGTVTVASSTSTGTYTITYQICEIGAVPENCATATVTLIVTKVQTPTNIINAENDTITIEVGSTSTETVHANDSLGGVGVNSSTVSTSILNDAGSGVAITSEGTVTVVSSTSTGTYTITYQICEIGAVPENCATATVVLIVTKVQTPTNVINAQNDTITIEVGSTSTETVHANDSLEGIGVNSSTVSTSILNDAGSGVAITSEGTVTVASSTSTGTYTITYQICEIGAVPENCATATVVLIVTKVQTPISYIIANDDEDEVLTGMTVGVRVLKNDENVPTTGTLSVVVSPTNGKVSLFNNGAFNNPSDDVIIYVPNKGFVGIDTFEYKICDGLGSCATALVTIKVLNDVIPYNGMSMNADGLNDFFYIRGIEDFPTNKVAIYNYSGIKVFEIKGYNNKEKVFKGHSNIGLTIAPSSKLPQGTYYYIIEYSDKNNRKYTKASWMYIKY